MIKFNMKKNIFYNHQIAKNNLDIKELSQHKKVEKKISVDINKLLNRVKIDKKSEIKKKFIFFSIAILLLGLMGTFLLIVK